MYSLYHSPADVLRYLLIDLGYGILPSGQNFESDDWPIFAHLEPNAPDNCITIFDTTNKMFGRSQVTGNIFEHQGIQVRIRSALSTTGYRKGGDIALSIDEDIYFNNITIEGKVYCVRSITRVGDINALGKDTVTPTKRSIYTINALMILKQLS